MSVYLSTVRLNLVKLHRGTVMQTPRSYSAIQLLVDIHMKDIYRQNVR